MGKNTIVKIANDEGSEKIKVYIIRRWRSCYLMTKNPK